VIATDYGSRFAGRAHPYYQSPTGSLEGFWDPRMVPVPGLPGITSIPFSTVAYQPFRGPAFPLGALTPGLLPTGQPGPEYAAPLDDDAIRDVVYDCIDTDPTILPDVDVEVEVKDGVVTIKGRVPGKRTKHAIGETAWWIPSVVDVNNQLQVSPRRERRQQRPGVARGAA